MKLRSARRIRQWTNVKYRRILLQIYKFFAGFRILIAFLHHFRFVRLSDFLHNKSLISF